MEKRPVPTSSTAPRSRPYWIKERESSTAATVSDAPPLDLEIKLAGHPGVGGANRLEDDREDTGYWIME
ncbi:hypothetical protein N7448_001194 [Penicillium atrosanguineum]|nr:hypothetical protein N7448_001194 [Penicillium atrosanguineum]